MSYYLPFQDLSRVLNFKDIGGKSINAVDVFALCIEYIKDIIFKKIKEERSEIREYDVRWVLTCPAMWNESARQFMIDAGEKVTMVTVCVLYELIVDV
jgi:molecular chaperone DnaK (HSP70)